MMIGKKKVLMPIEVPVDKYCWNFNGGNICEHFDNEGGHNTCDMGFHLEDAGEHGVLKGYKCLILETDWSI